MYIYVTCFNVLYIKGTIRYAYGTLYFPARVANNTVGDDISGTANAASTAMVKITDTTSVVVSVIL